MKCRELVGKKPIRRICGIGWFVRSRGDSFLLTFAPPEWISVPSSVIKMISRMKTATKLPIIGRYTSSRGPSGEGTQFEHESCSSCVLVFLAARPPLKLAKLVFYLFSVALIIGCANAVCSINPGRAEQLAATSLGRRGDDLTDINATTTPDHADMIVTFTV